MPLFPEVALWKRSLAVLTVFLVLLGVLFPVLLPRPSKVTRAGFERIEVGMNQREVEAVLGGPPGDYRDAPIPASIRVRDEWSGIEEPARLDSIEPVPIQPGKTEMWQGIEGLIVIGFDVAGTVRDRDFLEAYPEKPGTVQTLLWRLGRFLERMRNAGRK